MSDPRDQPPPRPRARRVDISAELRRQADDALRRQAMQGRPDKPKPRNVTVNVIRPAVDAPRTTAPPPEPEPEPEPDRTGVPHVRRDRLDVIAAHMRHAGMHPEVSRAGDLTVPEAEVPAARAMIAHLTRKATP